MAVIEKSGLMKYKDKSGNTYTAAKVGATTQAYIDSAIQSTIQNTWEASY